MSVVPAAMWSAIRKVATTWMRPVCAEIAQRTELGACSWCLVTCHVFFLLIGFLMAHERAPQPELDLLGARLDLHSEAREASGEWHGSDGSRGQSDLSCKKIPQSGSGTWWGCSYGVSGLPISQ